MTIRCISIASMAISVTPPRPPDTTSNHHCLRLPVVIVLSLKTIADITHSHEVP